MQLPDPTSGRPHHGRMLLSSLPAILADLSASLLLLSKGAGLGAAHGGGFLALILIHFLFYAKWGPGRRSGEASRATASRCIAFVLACAMLFFLRGGLLACLVELRGWSPQAGMLAAAGTTAVLLYFTGLFILYSPRAFSLMGVMSHRAAPLVVVAYVMALRLLYLGLPELLQEEAYYWNYAKHLDLSYLDHPPLMAWIIWAATALFGDSEFTVRVGAFVCWLVTAYFSFALTKDFFGRSAGFHALLLLSIAPFFFSTGFMMTPDAPLTACWAGALYFLAKALIEERRRAWWGVGVFLGLGMLSKYTIALLAPSTLLFLLVNRRMRKTLSGPEPYLAALVAAILFTPVIVWNANHEWVSFAFQSVRRVQEASHFYTHKLVLYSMLLMTPTALVTIVALCLSGRIPGASDDREEERASVRRRFALVFSLLPLAVFFLFSLTKEVKINWTGPLWLAAMPFLARFLSTLGSARIRRGFGFLKWAWPATIVLALLIYGAGFHYLSIGIPGVPYPKNFFLLGWKELAQKIEEVEDEMEGAAGAEPLVVGMDKMQIASELAFYRTRAGRAAGDPENEGALQTASRHLFWGDSLMYQFWFPEEDQEGRTMLLVARKLDEFLGVPSHVPEMGAAREVEIHKNGRRVGRYYYMTVKGYSRHHNDTAPDHPLPPGYFTFPSRTPR